MIIVADNFIQAGSHILTPISAFSSIRFSVKNFGVRTEGKFRRVKGEIYFDIFHLNDSFFNVLMDAASINTGIHLRDKHLTEEDYFFVSKFPTINFYSSSIHKASAGYLVQGNLTIKGITKLVEFPFSAIPSRSGYIFSGGFFVNRCAFGVGGKSPVLDNIVNITLDVITK